MRTTTRTPKRSAIAAIILTAGLAVGATACSSDDDPDDPGTPTETDMTDDTVMTDITDPLTTEG